MSVQDDLARTAMEWYKAQVPYVHRGTRRTGCDCTGLLIGCLREIGWLTQYKLRYYPRDWNLHSMGAQDDFLRKEMGRVANKVSRLPNPGDIILFRFGKCVAHCGICVNTTSFVHAYATSRKVAIGLFKTPKWFSRMAGVWEMDIEKMRRFNG